METVPELARLVPPVLRAWLATHGCDDAHWVPADDRPPRAAGAFVDFPLDLAGSALPWLVLRLHFRDGAALPPADRRALAQYLDGLAPFLATAAADADDPWVTLSRETLLVVEHQVRNHLNSLLMGAAALSMNAGGPEPDPVLEQIENDGLRCLDLVRQLLHPPP